MNSKPLAHFIVRSRLHWVKVNRADLMQIHNRLRQLLQATQAVRKSVSFMSHRDKDHLAQFGIWAYTAEDCARRMDCKLAVIQPFNVP